MPPDASVPSLNWSERTVDLWVCGVVLGMIGAALGAALVLTGGAFTYSLDDPYIHLALAEHLAGGHYGINAGEPSAPSSSPLWPFLLVPFARLSGGTLAPLIFNAAAAWAAAFVFARLARRVVPVTPAAAVVLAVALALATNLVGLVLTGMEHTLHVALSVAAVWGLVREIDDGRMPRWLPVVLVLGPLVRYEGLALTVPAVVVLFARGHRLAALGVLAATAGLLATFSAFLLGLGLGPLPTSVYAHAPSLEGGRAVGLVKDFLRNATSAQGLAALAAVLVLLDAGLGTQSRYRALALWAVAAILLHLTFGDFRGFARYDCYLAATVLSVLLIVFREGIGRAAARLPVQRLALLALAAVLLTSPARLLATVLTPLASQNVHQQQRQMGRFARAYGAPVAVNDIGLVSYRNPQYVLDLWGLASREALTLRQGGGDPQWMSAIAAWKNVRVAMVYDAWFPVLPADWKRLGTLHLGGPRVAVGSETVTFYALDAAGATRAQRVLPGWARGLPPGVRFEPAP